MSRSDDDIFFVVLLVGVSVGIFIGLIVMSGKYDAGFDAACEQVDRVHVEINGKDRCMEREAAEPVLK